MKKFRVFLKKNIITILGTAISLGLVAYFCITTGIDTFRRILSKLFPVAFCRGSGDVSLLAVRGRWRCMCSFTTSIPKGVFCVPSASRWLPALQRHHPFASGGQPMQLYEMTVHDGMSMGSASSVMTRKCLVFQVGVTAFSLVALITPIRSSPRIFRDFGCHLHRSRAEHALSCRAADAFLQPQADRQADQRPRQVFYQDPPDQNPQNIRERVDNQLRLFHESGRMFSTARVVIVLVFFHLFAALLLFSDSLLRLSLLWADGRAGGHDGRGRAHVYMISAFMPFPAAPAPRKAAFICCFCFFSATRSLPPQCSFGGPSPIIPA